MFAHQFMKIAVCVCMHACMYIGIFVHVCAHQVHENSCMCMCMCVCVYLFVYGHKNVRICYMYIKISWQVFSGQNLGETRMCTCQITLS